MSEASQLDAALDMNRSGNPISVLVVDDHPLLREGIVAAIDDEADMKVVAQACNGVEAIERFRLHRPDVTLMDLQMPVMDGVAAITAIRAEYPAARIVMLTTYRGDALAIRALRAGASGYLLKTMIRTDLLIAVRCVHAGERRIPPEIAAEIAAHATDEALSARELEVLGGVAGGNTNKKIAAQLAITEETVKSHMRNIMEKLSARDRTHAVLIAVKRGIIDS